MYKSVVDSCFSFPLSLLGKSNHFVTADDALKRKILLLPDSRWHINSRRFVLVIGEQGVGKKTLVHYAWRKLRQRHRPLVGVNCTRLKNVHHLELYFDLAAGGDLFLEDLQVLPALLQQRLPLLQARHNNVRLLATADSVCCKLDAAIISIPSLPARRADQRLLLNYFLRHTFPHIHLQAAVEDRICAQQFATASEIYSYLTNLAFICSYTGYRNVDVQMLRWVDECNATERLQLQIMYLISNSGMHQLLEEHSLPELCQLLENSLIANSLLEAGHNQVVASRILRIPATTLSSKKAKLPFILQKGTRLKTSSRYGAQNNLRGS
ncbi:MAG: sigma 54-interacting transcriptional regulator [Pseudomonadota bacterium]|nr:sigma 54-interacting transcriptional regulator [Pseudomonadota bacterium]